MLWFSGISTLVIMLGLVYNTITMAMGIWRSRRKARAERRRLDREIQIPEGKYHLYVIIACLNEEAVIEETVRQLVGLGPSVSVLVMDDGSDDETSQRAMAGGGNTGRARVIRRELPNARQGKGMALNQGYWAIVRDARARKFDPSNVLVCVMDADGRLSPGVLSHVLPLFERPEIGGAQLAVRIRNRGKLIGRMQDLEFWGVSAVSQVGRIATSTVSLGGNGQFSRLSALLALRENPWSESLTEDLDLAVTLATKGWQLTTTPLAWVEQEGLESWRRLIKQRTRWMQGHMTTGKRIAEIWRSPHMSTPAIFELTMYLLIPWALIMPWSIIFHVALGMMTYQWVTGEAIPFAQDTMFATFTSVYFWFLLSCWANILAGVLYYQRDRSIGLVKALILGNLLLPCNYVAYFATWRAFVRILRGKTGWDKTQRIGDGKMQQRATQAKVGAR